VTAVIPCHNHREWIQRAIKSVTSQCYPSKKVVTIDSGSTDGSEEAIREIIENPQEGADGLEGTVDGVPILLLPRCEADGPSAARNRCIKATWLVSDAYAILDADDYMLPGKLTKCMKKLTGHVCLVYNDMYIYNTRTGVTIHEFRRPYDRQELERDCIISNNPVISRGGLEAAGFYDEEMRTAEDWDLWLRLTEHGSAVHIPEPLAVYTDTGENCTYTVPQEVWQQNWQRVHAKLMQRRNAQPGH